MPDGLYERDALAWAEQQAGLLRRFADGERLNETIDWPNLIEQVESVGRSELRNCESLLRQALVHLLKLHCCAGSPAAAHWRSGAIGFLADARRSYTPSMRHRIDVAGLYLDALRQVQAGADAPVTASAKCPIQLDELLSATPDIMQLTAMLRG